MPASKHRRSGRRRRPDRSPGGLPQWRPADDLVVIVASCDRPGCGEHPPLRQLVRRTIWPQKREEAPADTGAPSATPPSAAEARHDRQHGT